MQIKIKNLKTGKIEIPEFVNIDKDGNLYCNGYEIIYIIRHVNSYKLIKAIRKRFKELKKKGFKWRSFYNGFLEGYFYILFETKNLNNGIKFK